jgi:WD40 repeat protein
METGQILFKIEYPSIHIPKVFSPNGIYLALVNPFGMELKIWSTELGTELYAIEAETELFPLTFTQDGNSLIIATENGYLQIWNMQDGSLEYEVLAHAGNGFYGQLLQNGQILVTYGKDGTIKFWETKNWQLLYTLFGATNSIESMAVTKNHIAVASAFDAKIWSIETGEIIINLTNVDGGVKDVAISSDETLIATTGSIFQDGEFFTIFRLWDFNGIQISSHIQQFGDPTISHVAFSPNGNLVSTSSGHSINLWDRQGNLLSENQMGHHNLIRDLQFSSDSTLLISTGQDSWTRVWDINTYENLAEYNSNVSWGYAIDLTSDNRSLAIVEGSQFTLWNVEKNVQNLILEDVSILSVAFSPDGRIYALGDVYGEIQVFESETNLPLISLKGHTNGIVDLAFSPDGIELFSASTDGTVRIWSIEP